MRIYLKSDFELDHASEAFSEAASGIGGPSINCSCGIDHVAIHNDFYTSGDGTLPKESKSVVHHDYEFVSSFELNNHVIVRDCEGCMKTAKRYEDFIWEHRDHIREYLKIRIDTEKSWSDQEHMKNILCGIDSKHK